ncbi:hypothetical protein VVATL9824_03002 [Vibrio vulnificus]|nr:hypothetical protein VVATL9824_03002 [Vibrio vulnificus]
MQLSITMKTMHLYKSTANKLFKSDSQRVAFLLCVGSSV